MCLLPQVTALPHNEERRDHQEDEREGGVRVVVGSGLATAATAVLGRGPADVAEVLERVQIDDNLSELRNEHGAVDAGFVGAELGASDTDVQSQPASAALGFLVDSQELHPHGGDSVLSDLTDAIAGQNGFHLQSLEGSDLSSEVLSDVAVPVEANDRILVFQRSFGDVDEREHLFPGRAIENAGTHSTIQARNSTHDEVSVHLL